MERVRIEGGHPVAGQELARHWVGDNRMSFRVDLDSFRGPLDLLLFLVRKHEVQVAEIPIALIADQYVEHLSVLEELDVDAVGDFLELASTLIEIKSRTVLPRGDEESQEIQDPRDELVERLLAYKKYKDAATILEDQSRQWQLHYGRVADDHPDPRPDMSEQPIREVELWDLVSAFGRVIRDSRAVQPSNIVYDDTPIQVYMQRIHEKLGREGRVAFSDMFSVGMHKSAMIGVFLAVLELVRHHSIDTRQPDAHGEIWILPGKNLDRMLDLDKIDDYEPSPQDPPSEAAKPR